MKPFIIETCFGGITPQVISDKDFDAKLINEEQRIIEIPLKSGISNEAIWQKIRNQTTLGLISRSENKLRMFGKNLQGQDIGIDSEIVNVGGDVYIKSVVFGEAMKNIFGVLCDMFEAIKDFKEEVREDHRGIKESLDQIITEIRTKYESYEKLEGDFNILFKQQRGLNEKYEALINSGRLDQIGMIETELQKIRESLKTNLAKQNIVLNELSDKVLEILEQQGISDEKIDEMFLYIRDHLASDWERIKGSWKEYKEGKINKKTLIWRGIKGLGKKMLTKIPGIGIDIGKSMTVKN